MAATRTVVTRSRRDEKPASKEFNFTKEMIPYQSADGGEYPSFLANYRSSAWNNYACLPIPTIQDEAWRRTDIRGLEAGSFQLPDASFSTAYPAPPAELLQPLAGNDHGGQILLLPGGDTRISVEKDLLSHGVIFTDLRSAINDHPQIVEKILGKIVRPDEGKFAALAASMANSGVVVYIPKGITVDQPLHSVLWGPGSGLAYFSHILVWVDDGASLTYVHESASNTEVHGQTLHAGIVEIHVGEGANLRFVELQSWGEHVWNFTHERVRVERDGNMDWIFGAIGSHLTKNFSDLDP